MKKQAFAVRIESEILSKIDRIPVGEDRSRGAVIRRIIQQFFLKEESHDSNNHRENDRPGNDVGNGGGL